LFLEANHVCNVGLKMNKKIFRLIIILLVIAIAVLAGVFYPKWEEASHEHHEEAGIQTQISSKYLSCTENFGI